MVGKMEATFSLPKWSVPCTFEKNSSSKTLRKIQYDGKLKKNRQIPSKLYNYKRLSKVFNTLH